MMKHGGGALDEEPWVSNYGCGIMERSSWRRKSWGRNHGRGIWEASRKHLGSIWGCLGSIWGASGRLMGSIWEASWRLLGSFWKLAGLGASGNRKKSITHDTNNTCDNFA